MLPPNFEGIRRSAPATKDLQKAINYSIAEWWDRARHDERAGFRNGNGQELTLLNYPNGKCFKY